MFKNRYLIIAVGAVLIVAVILIANAIGPQVGAISGQPPVGFGDLRYAEALQAKASTFSSGSMGDLRRFEGQQSSLNAGTVQAFDGMSGRSPGNLAAISAVSSKLTRAQQAELARWNALAGISATSPMLTKAQQAELARWNGLAALSANSPMLTRAQQAELARWNGLAALSTTSPMLTRAQQTELARWNGLAAQAGAMPMLAKRGYRVKLGR